MVRQRPKHEAASRLLSSHGPRSVDKPAAHRGRVPRRFRFGAERFSVDGPFLMPSDGGGQMASTTQRFSAAS